MRGGASRHGAASVVVVGVDSTTMGLIRETLGTEAVLPNSATPYDAAVDEARKSRPNVIIVGFDKDFEEAIRLGPAIQHEVPGITLVALAQKPEQERIRAAMRAGYRDYLTLPDDATLLRQAVHESAGAGTSPEDQGEVIAVIGASGGAGVTTIASNLATEMSELQRVCVVDFGFSMGDVATAFNLVPKSSIFDVIRNIDRLDERMLRGSVTVHRSKAHIIAQPSDLSDSVELREDDTLRVLTAIADAYQFVIVDCTNQLNPATVTTTSVADLVLLVCTPDVVSVRNAIRRLALMTRLGNDKDAVRLIVNKWDPKNAQISLNDIASHVGIPVAATVAWDPTTAARALTKGEMLRDTDRKSQMVRDLAAAVELITDKAQKVKAEEVTSSLLGKLFK